MERTILLYDGDCGFCRASLGLILAWDRRHRLRPLRLQDPEAKELLGDLSEAERMASWHLVRPGGGRVRAGAALAPLLRELPAGTPLAALLDRVPGLAGPAYRWVADRRATLGRLVPRGAARRADRLIARRA